MAQNYMATQAEKVVGHSDQDRAAHTDIANPAREGGKYADPSGEKMKALVWMGKNDVRVVETSKPVIIDDHDAIVKITGSTVCGSDVHILHGQIVQTEKGDILGHEFCGIVESVGPAVQNVKPGTRVVNSFCISCGECEFCKKKLPTACEKTNASTLQKIMYSGQSSGIFGYSHFVGGYAGGQAEYVRVPLADNNLLKIPDSVPDEKGLYLSDVLPTSYHAVTYTGVKEGDTVAVWGLGPIGFMSCFWAFHKGAKRVIGIDNNWRTEYAKSKIKGLETINYKALGKDKTVPSKVHELVPGGVDVSIDATGGEYGKGWIHSLELAVGAEQDTSEMINEAIYSTRKFGRVGLIGDYVGFTNHFNVGAVMELGITLVGCGQAPVQRYWEELREKIEKGEVDPTIMVTHRFRIDDIAKAYYMQEKRQDGLVKCFVETRFSAPRAQGTPELTTL
ncbi:GroES-like protein [Trichoderma longibrachiatum]|uniref:GroES-like protein n=1 Tax=Trichoderma longibrachiatum ATCC 18648 TaxID=983965 RepID=A0A2T4BR73_TRILO|nr:GroES-like protein [Trichoderma longibrachiatum ATCC 18648]